MKVLKSHFWPEKYINMCPQYTKRWRIATFGRVCSLRKRRFFNIFMRKSWFMIFDITMELHCNLKSHKSWFSHENIERKNFFKRKHTPQMLLFCIFWYTVSPYWYIFLDKKLDFKIFIYSPIIKFMFSLYNLKKAFYSRKMVGKLNLFDKLAPNTHTQQWLK